MIRLGASLVQVYTALVYEGPGVVRRITEARELWPATACAASATPSARASERCVNCAGWGVVPSRPDAASAG